MDNLTPAALQIFAYTPDPETLDRGEGPLDRAGFRFTLSDGSVQEWRSSRLFSQTRKTDPNKFHIRVRAFAESGRGGCEVFRVLVEERDPSRFDDGEDPTVYAGMHTVHFRKEWGSDEWEAPSVTWSQIDGYRVDELYRDDRWMADGAPSLSRIMRELMGDEYSYDSYGDDCCDDWADHKVRSAESGWG